MTEEKWRVGGPVASEGRPGAASTIATLRAGPALPVAVVGAGALLQLRGARRAALVHERQSPGGKNEGGTKDSWPLLAEEKGGAAHRCSP
ncbi:hypothetical protein L7F22_008127 [Adiantum nelumboides]|nr:hypothetical protein [Adiantum nelumboides]